MALPFEALAPFKTLLKRFFSTEPWGLDEDRALAAVVAPHLTEGWWHHDLGEGLAIAYGIRDGRFTLEASGAETARASLFDRVFAGPVVPEATPHPRKVKFSTGGVPAPGRWYRRSDPEPPRDPRVLRLLEERDVTDVMVAGDFVTVGLERRSSWETRLDPILSLVTDLFWVGEPHDAPARTRDELLHEAGYLQHRTTTLDLHLLDPDRADDRRRLVEALAADEGQVRRVAVAVLAESQDAGVRLGALRRGWEDRSRIVRRTAVDAAADQGDQALRPLLEEALADEDAWIRWRAVRALAEIGAEPSKALVAALEADPDFNVRFEVARVLRA
jgi:hypothetical protein